MLSFFRTRAIGYPGVGTMFLAWTMLGGLSYARHVLLIDAVHGNVFVDLASWMTGYYPWLILSPVVFRLEQRFPVQKIGLSRHLAYLAAASVPLTYAAHELTLSFSTILHLSVKAPLPQPATWWSAIQRCEFLLQQFLYWSTVVAACVIRNFLERRESERKSAALALEKSRLEGSLRQAELETLRMRLNPHFLFNSLQNISSLTKRDPEIANQMLSKLGDLLRSTLRKGAQQETTLADEIELTKSYVAVEQMRFADRLSILFDIEPNLEMASVPSFILQPLIENAIIHGLRGDKRDGVIWVRARHASNQLLLTVSDNGSGPPKARLADLEMGIGLGSTCDRLSHLYPDQHTISVQRLPEGVTEVQITLPLKRKDRELRQSSHEIASLAHR